MATGQILKVDRPDEHGAQAQLVTLPGADRTHEHRGTARRRGFHARPARVEDGRVLTTVLMTDIVDSTRTVARLGDRRWRDLLVEHYAQCREHVELAGGELVGTVGDGIVAIFDAPTRAIRAGMAIQASARAGDLAVRAAVHTGECERIGSDITGIAVHIAARICALGGDDAVVTTGTVRDLVIGSMLSFEPRGDHELRGVPGRWALYGAVDAA